MRVYAAARDEDPGGALEALDRYRLLCAHREGPFGVRRWNQLVERWLAEAGVDVYDQWYVGRPLLVTSNDYALDVYNGEIGVVVRQGQRRRAFVSGSDGLKEFAPGPARRRRDDARDDDPQGPGQPGRRRSPCCCPRRARGC